MYILSFDGIPWILNTVFSFSDFFLSFLFFVCDISEGVSSGLDSLSSASLSLLLRLSVVFLFGVLNSSFLEFRLDFSFICLSP